MTSSQTNDVRSAPTAKTTLNTLPIRVKKSTARTLRGLVKKLNKKQLGRKVVADDVIAKAISLIESKHLEEIKILTYSSIDLLELEFIEYCQKNGPISKEVFLKKLLEAGLPNLANSYQKQNNTSEDVNSISIIKSKS